MGKILEKGRCGRPLAWAAVAFALAAVPGAAAGGSLRQALAPLPHPFAIPVKLQRCTRLIPTGGREVIVNSCNTCQTVGITRKRPGIALPVMRSFSVQAKSTFQVPFRGPGRSRLTSERACKGEAGASENLVVPGLKRKTGKACVHLEKARNGGVALVNNCRVCKAVLIERQNRFGGNSQRQAYKVPPSTVLPVPSKGQARIGLVGEIPCPRA
ncbi:MAG: hypothetical protein IH994_06240 [Proteobacteria bacterium]|nr:hypothetical protein [Pseudomonadota bacterium]